MSTDDQSEKIQHLQGENARLQAEVHALTAALSKGQESLAASEIRLKLAYLATIQVLVQAVEIKDPYTVGHSNMTAKVAVAIARRLKSGDEDCERLRIAALLLDIGKLGVSRKLLTKRDPLPEEERRLLEEHVQFGAQIIEPVIYPWEVAALVYQHHERIDGSGYPEGLTGDQMDFEAKILGLADAFVAMLADRAYRKAYDEAEVLAYFREQAGKTFDSGCVAALEAVLGKDAQLREELTHYRKSLTL